MKKIVVLPIVLAVAIAVFNSCNGGRASIVTGFRVYKDFDSSRTFDTTRPDRKGTYYRPVKIDFFYPSDEEPGQTALTYGDVLNQYEERFGYDVSTDSSQKVSLALANAFGDYLHVDPSKLMAYQTAIYRDLPLPRKKYPLIIYASGMNGSSWENPCLYDTLVHHGYVVAVVSSVGKYPGYMSEATDLGEQVSDILFTLRQLKTMACVDTARIGLLSWSLGGSAITKAAMLSRDIKCLLSFDGSEIHYYGFDTAWDREYRQIVSLAPYNPSAITVPYMYLSSEHPRNVDSIYVFPAFVGSSQKFFLKFRNSIHEDFSSLPTLAKAVDTTLGNIDSGRHDIITGLTIRFFDEFLKGADPGGTTRMIDRLVQDKPRLVDTSYPSR